MNVENDDAGETQVDELSLLKDRARTMGISVAGNVSAETLKSRINERLAGTPEESPAVVETPVGAARPQTKSEMEQDIRTKLRTESLALVRCRIYNLNPSKRDLQGEIITVGNRFMGTIRKFIPFGEATDGGYHIPKVIYEDLRARKYQHVTTKTVKGQIEVKTRLVPEYNIEVLAPLSKDELQELATKQAAVQRLSND